MKYPCKKCLVISMCEKEKSGCNEYLSYARFKARKHELRKAIADKLSDPTLIGLILFTFIIFMMVMIFIKGVSLNDTL